MRVSKDNTQLDQIWHLAEGTAGCFGFRGVWVQRRKGWHVPLGAAGPP